MESQTLEQSPVPRPHEWTEDLGYFELLQAVREYDPALEKVADATGETAEPAVEFLGDCLSERQLEVVKLAARSAINLNETDERLWSRIRGSVLKHPAVIGKLASFSEDLHLSNYDEPAWKDEAACKGNAEFVSSGIKSAKTRFELLKICEGCPVYDECFDEVTDRRPEAGIWAGVVRTKSGRKGGNGYREDGSPRTIQEERRALSQAPRPNGKRK